MTARAVRSRARCGMRPVHSRPVTARFSQGPLRCAAAEIDDETRESLLGIGRFAPQPRIAKSINSKRRPPPFVQPRAGQNPAADPRDAVPVTVLCRALARPVSFRQRRASAHSRAPTGGRQDCVLPRARPWRAGPPTLRAVSIRPAARARRGEMDRATRSRRARNCRYFPPVSARTWKRTGAIENASRDRKGRQANSSVRCRPSSTRQDRTAASSRRLPPRPTKASGARRHTNDRDRRARRDPARARGRLRKSSRACPRAELARLR